MDLKSTYHQWPKISPIVKGVTPLITEIVLIIELHPVNNEPLSMTESKAEAHLSTCLMSA
jgi:hypothetical protein